MTQNSDEQADEVGGSKVLVKLPHQNCWKILDVVQILLLLAHSNSQLVLHQEFQPGQ